jgi:maleate isomerase
MQISNEKTVDRLGWRLKLGVVVPATNTIVEPEFAGMRPHGVTNHTMRFFVENLALSSSEDFARLIEIVKANLDAAIDFLVPSGPDCIVLGMSAETFWDGLDGSKKLEARLSERAGGKPVAMGSDACLAALNAVGARRIGVITPYWPVGDEQVRRFFTEAGFEITGIKGLKCRSPHHIAAQTEDTLRDAMRELDAANPDAIVQVGTNLCMAQLAAEAERWMGKPVIAINTAIYWHALRRNGIIDRVQGWGALLAEH